MKFLLLVMMLLSTPALAAEGDANAGTEPALSQPEMVGMAAFFCSYQPESEEAIEEDAPRVAAYTVYIDIRQINELALNANDADVELPVYVVDALGILTQSWMRSVETEKGKTIKLLVLSPAFGTVKTLEIPNVTGTEAEARLVAADGKEKKLDCALNQ